MNSLVPSSIAKFVRRKKQEKIEQEKFSVKADKVYKQYEKYLCGEITSDEFHELVEALDDIKTCKYYRKLGMIKEKYEEINIHHLRKKVLMDEILLN